MILKKRTSARRRSSVSLSVASASVASAIAVIAALAPASGAAAEPETNKNAQGAPPAEARIRMVDHDQIQDWSGWTVAHWGIDNYGRPFATESRDASNPENRDQARALREANDRPAQASPPTAKFRRLLRPHRESALSQAVVVESSGMSSKATSPSSVQATSGNSGSDRSSNAAVGPAGGTTAAREYRGRPQRTGWT